MIAHLDATEIHRVTNKPTRAVSLFLFTDKILVASKSCMDAKEIDIDELLMTTNTSTSLFPSKNEKGLKFKGWADIESIELFDGLTGPSFILSATKLQSSNITSFEKYFCKGPRLFSVKSNVWKKINHFKDIYQKTRALVKQCGKILKNHYVSITHSTQNSQIRLFTRCGKVYPRFVMYITPKTTYKLNTRYILINSVLFFIYFTNMPSRMIL